MPSENTASQHHLSAATHHERAAHFHREAATHYLIGKDYAHAAHQALIAQGHAWHAIDHGNEASKHYADNDGAGCLIPSEKALRLPQKTLDIQGDQPSELSAAEHHAAAAVHSDQAARHHRLASKHCEDKDYVLAAHEGQIAHNYTKAAIFHASEAAKNHLDLYGKSELTSNIIDFAATAL